MITPDVEAQSFMIYMKNGDVKYYMKSEDKQYQWALTPNGDILIYKKEFHATFTTVAVKDERLEAIAQGTWDGVEVIEEEVEEKPELVTEEDIESVIVDATGK